MSEGGDFLDNMDSAKREKVRLTTYLPKALAHKLKVYAALNKVAGATVIERAVEKELASFILPERGSKT